MTSVFDPSPMHVLLVIFESHVTMTTTGHYKLSRDYHTATFKDNLGVVLNFLLVFFLSFHRLLKIQTNDRQFTTITKKLPVDEQG